VDISSTEATRCNDLQYHVVWMTKYRYKMLQGRVAKRLRELIRQGCEARNIKIVHGSIGKEHVHLLLSCPPTLAPSKILQYLKGRSSKLLQEEFQELRKRYWGQHLWAPGLCRTVRTVTEEIIKEYIENQGKERNDDTFRIEE